MSGSTLPVTPGSGTAVQGSTSSSSNFLQSVGIEDKDSGVVQSIFDAGTGQHAALVASAYKEYSGLSAGSLNADLFPSTDVSGYKSLSLQTTGAWSGTLSFQGSNDNTNWIGIQLDNTSSGSASGAGGVSTTGNSIYTGMIAFRYFRARLTAYTSGTANGVLELYTLPAGKQGVVASSVQNGTWNFGASSSTGATAPTTALEEGVIGRSTAPTAVTNGQLVGGLGDLLGTRMTSSGGLQTTAIGGGTSGNTVIKASSGRICRVLVTTLGTNAMLFYDNASTNSGTVVGVVPASAAVGSVYDFNLPSANGITVAGNASNPAVTVGFS